MQGKRRASKCGLGEGKFCLQQRLAGIFREYAARGIS